MFDTYSPIYSTSRFIPKMYQKHFSVDPNSSNSTNSSIPSFSNGKVALIKVLSDPSNSTYPLRESQSSPSPTAALGSIKPTPTFTASSLPPPYFDAPHSYSLSDVSHWRTRFLVVLLPLVPWGIPAHLLLRSRPRRITSSRTWLKYLCPLNSPLTSILSLIQVLLTLFFNFIFLHFVYSIFNTLLIKGALRMSLLSDAASILRVLVLIIPLNLIWIKGHSLHRLIASFDRLTSEFLLLDPFNKNEAEAKPSYWLKLILIYLAIIVIFTLSWISIYYSPTGWPFSNLPLYDQLIHNGVYTMNILTSLVFPVYCSFCWAIHHQLQLLRKYLSYLIKSKVPAAYVHLDNVKHFYMKIADNVILINRMFSVYLALVVASMALFLYAEFEQVSGKLLEAFSGSLVAAIVPLIKGKEGTDTPINEVDLEELRSPYKVRLIVADIVGFLLYVSIVWLSYWQAVKTNDEIRFLNIWLNDFVTEPQSRLHPELHGAVTLLKCYIHVRLEQELPALLNISVVSLIPSLKRRLIDYRVIH